jgi:RNase P/RNase MRP subunit POP5
MKPLKPSHREHKRYILISGKDASQKNIDESILKFVGILGYAKASPQIVKGKGEKVIIAINRSELDKIRASFALSGLDIHVDKVSGAINNLG